MGRKISDYEIRGAEAKIMEYFNDPANADDVRSVGELMNTLGLKETVTRKALTRLTARDALFGHVFTEDPATYGVLSTLYGARLGTSYFMLPATWEARVARHKARLRAENEKPYRLKAEQNILLRYAAEVEAEFQRLLGEGL